MLKSKCSIAAAGTQFCYSSGKVLSLPPQSSATAGAKFSRCSRTVLPLLWHCIATEVGELCAGGRRTLRRQWENYEGVSKLTTTD